MDRRPRRSTADVTKMVGGGIVGARDRHHVMVWRAIVRRLLRTPGEPSSDAG
jgi:hypothetical protein